MDRDGMDEDDAVEWLEVNTLGAYNGESTPAMLVRCTMRELGEECGIEVPTGEERDYGDEHVDMEERLNDEERELLDEAIANYTFNFINYIKEVDNKLFLRAREYAADCSGNSVVEFVIDEEKKEEDHNEDCD